MKREAFNHPKMLDLAARLAVSRTHACGIVANLWNWAADTAPQGNIGKWSDGVIARAMEWDGDAMEFVTALVEAGWVDRCTEHRLVIHDLEDHSPEWLKTKLKRTKKWFYKATKPSQCTGASAPASDQCTPTHLQRSDAGALHSALLCSTPLCSPLLDSAPGEVSPTPPLADEPQAVLMAWNATAGATRTETLGQSRLNAIKLLLIDPGWRWRDALAKFPLKCYASEPEGWQPTFDWFIKPDTVTKILEGTYDFTKGRNNGNRNARPAYKPDPGLEYVEPDELAGSR